MTLKCVSSLKRVYRKRDLPPYSEGFIGKSVPFSPTFLGVFILKQYYNDILRRKKWFKEGGSNS